MTMAQKTPGASIPITNYRRNICPSEKMLFAKVAEDFSKQKLTLLNCDWKQSAKIIQMSRVNERLSNQLYQQNTNPLSEPTCLENYNVSISDVPQALTVLCHFPFTYSFSENLMISQVDQGGNYLAVTLPRLLHTPFYFLRLFVHDKTITEYSYDEYGFQKSEYLMAEKLASEYGYAGSWGGDYPEIMAGGFLASPYLLAEHSEYGRLFYIYDCRDKISCLFEMIPVGKDVLVLPCSYRNRNGLSGLSKVYFQQSANVFIWGMDKICTPATGHVILYHNPGIMRLKFPNDSVATGCILGGLDSIPYVSCEGLHKKQNHILISENTFDLAFALNLAVTMKRQGVPVVRFMKIESANRNETDYNWDGIMYPATQLSDMQIQKITPAELRLLAESNGVQIPENFVNYFEQVY